MVVQFLRVTVCDDCAGEQPIMPDLLAFRKDSFLRETELKARGADVVGGLLLREDRRSL